MKSRAAPSGFALLLTLLLVVIVGIALAGLARWSMLGAVESRDAAEEVQRRWAIVSCQATFLPLVPELLEVAEEGPGTFCACVGEPPKNGKATRTQTHARETRVVNRDIC